ncbi:MAG TPA: hypothetical protein VGE29_16955 [Prosthecobacter sp.]
MAGRVMNWGVEEMLRVAARMANEQGCEVRVGRQGDFCVRPLGKEARQPAATSTERVRRHRLARKLARASATATPHAENEQCEILSGDVTPAAAAEEVNGKPAVEDSAPAACAGEGQEARVYEDAEPGMPARTPALEGPLPEHGKGLRHEEKTLPGHAAACAPHPVCGQKPGLLAGAETASPQGDETQATLHGVSPGEAAPSFPPSPPSPSPPSSTPAHTPAPPPAYQARGRRRRRKGSAAPGADVEKTVEAANAEPLPPGLDTAVFRPVWEKWCQHRSMLARRHPEKAWNPDAARYTLEECLHHGEETALVALRLSLANSWQSLVWERVLAWQKTAKKAERKAQAAPSGVSFPSRDHHDGRRCDSPRPRHRAYQVSEATRGLTPAQISGF